MIRICPSEALLDLLEKIPEQFIVKNKRVQDKPSCPLCLLAVTQIYNVIKDNKTEVLICYMLDLSCYGCLII